MGSAASGTSFLTQKYKGFSKFIKGNYSRMSFQFLSLNISSKAKSASEAAFLRSRRFFRHPYQWHGSTMAPMATMAISLIWPIWPYCHSGHIDIDDATPLILVSKEASGPQECSLWSRFCLRNDLEGQKLKTHTEIFSLYKVLKSFVFLGEKLRSRGSTSHHLSDLIFMFLESVDLKGWGQLES